MIVTVKKCRESNRLKLSPDALNPFLGVLSISHILSTKNSRKVKRVTTQTRGSVGSLREVNTLRSRPEFGPASPPGMPRPRTSVSANLQFTRTSSEVGVRWIETGRIFWRSAAGLSPGSIRRVNDSGMHMAIAGTLNVWGVSRSLWSGLVARHPTVVAHVPALHTSQNSEADGICTEVGAEATMIA